MLLHEPSPTPRMKPPPVPLGDDWLVTGCLSLKLTFRNKKNPNQGGVGEGSWGIIWTVLVYI